MRRKIENLICAVTRLCFLLFALTDLASPQHAVKLWSVDLSKDEDFSRRRQAYESVLRPPTVDFLNEDQVILAFDDSAMSIPSPKMTPFGFHVLQIETASGSLGKKLSFEVLLNTSQAQPTGNGDFLVLEGEELKKFSTSFKELASFPTPLKLHGQPTEQQTGGGYYLNPRYETWRMDVAPGRRVFVLAHVKDPRQMELTWLRTSDFATIASVGRTPSDQQGMSAGNQAVWLFPYGWAKLVSPSGEDYSLCERCLRGYFLTDDLVFLDKRNKYTVQTISGEVKAAGKLELGTTKFCRAANASRLAYATGHCKGSGFPLTTHFAAHMEVKAFDWTTMKQIADLTFDEPERPVSSGFKQSAIALSHPMAVGCSF